MRLFVNFLPPSSVTSIIFNASVPYREELRPSSRAILTSEPYITLPERLAHIIHVGIGAKWLDMTLSQVPCHTRPYLPEIIFEMGGHNFSINGWDYVFEIEPEINVGTVCVVWFEVADDEQDFVMLGSLFLRRFYTRFDLDKREVGCMYRQINR